MAPKLFFARHGQTAWNASRRYQGQADIPLDETGERQAAALGERMAQYKLEAVYASDLQRAWKTASAVAQYHNCPLVSEPRLREMSFGEWQGLTHAEMQQRNPGRLQAWDADRLHNAPPGGETLLELAERVRAVLAQIVKEHEEGTVMIVSHAGPLKVMLCEMLEAPLENFWRFQISHTSVSAVSIYPDGAILEQLNDCCHLDGIG